MPDFGMGIVGSFFKDGTQAQVMRQANQKLHAPVTSSPGDGNPIKHIVKQGSAYQEILDTATEPNVSMTVMGAHRPDLSDYLPGPNAALVARHAKASVFVIRDEN